MVYRGYTATPNATTGLHLDAAAAGRRLGVRSGVDAVRSRPPPTPAIPPRPRTSPAAASRSRPTPTPAPPARRRPSRPTSAENAVESPWEQNQWFIPALAAVGITAVGDDASKPYPNPPDTQFGYRGQLHRRRIPGRARPSWTGSAQVVPRHPVNIYYNAGDGRPGARRVPDAVSRLARSPAPPTCNFRDVITQVVSGLFSTMMANDPRPSYVHQTNIIGTPPAGSEESPDLLPPATYVASRRRAPRGLRARPATERCTRRSTRCSTSTTSTSTPTPRSSS